ncbi:M3 family oligoendopeptidase [bacterium]|nr:M3 family oligoendopeptidase [bacterium]
MAEEAIQDTVQWDLTSYFPEFDGPEYKAHVEKLEEDIDQMGKDAQALKEITTENTDQWAELICRDEEITCNFSHWASYIGCLNSADSRNEDYKREQARMSRIGAQYRKAGVPIMAALRDVTDDAFEKLVSHPSMETARFSMERGRIDAKRTMDPELEMLAADLSVDGMSAWGRLYNDLAGRLEFEMKKPDGSTEMVPMAQRRSLLEDPDPAVRKAAFVGSNKAWQDVEHVAAACLNGIGGWRLTLNEKRGIDHFLDVAMFQSATEQKTIDQMWDVISRNRDVAWEYLRTKAKLIGRDKLGFQDIGAPLPLKDARRFSWKEGTQMVFDAFNDFYPELAQFTKMMLDEKRVESEKRPGKRPGAFCTSSYKTKESRVFMTYGGSLGDIQTLAHELGHAFHNWVMRDIRPFARSYPMTLAETASTFAESVLCSGIIDSDSTTDMMKAQLLNTQLDHAAVFMCDIHMRYIFEKMFYEERQKGELSVSRIKELMLKAQRETFGDILNEDEMDPMFWASKLHFYITGVTFYNFPYTFGYFFSRGIFSRAKAEGASFLPKYEQLLRLTGSDVSEGVAKRSIDVDLTGPAFWEETIEGIRADLAKFQEVVPKVLGNS